LAAVAWKQPVEGCPKQETPFGSVLLAGPVVSGERSTGSVPTKVPSMQALPGVQGCVASTPPVTQSRVSPSELVEVHASPVRGPRSHKPGAGLAGLPFTGPPPLRPTGRGPRTLP